MKNITKTKAIFLTLATIYILTFFLAIFNILSLLDNAKLTQISLTIKTFMINNIEITSLFLLISIIVFSFLSRAEQINEISNIPYQWNLYKQRVDKLSKSFKEQSEKYCTRANNVTKQFEKKEFHLTIMQERANCNYLIYSNNLKVSYRTVTINTSSLQYEVLTICKSTNLGKIPEFISCYNEYKKTLDTLETLTKR